MTEAFSAAANIGIAAVTRSWQRETKHCTHSLRQMRQSVRSSTERTPKGRRRNINKGKTFLLRKVQDEKRF